MSHRELGVIPPKDVLQLVTATALVVVFAVEELAWRTVVSWIDGVEKKGRCALSGEALDSYGLTHEQAVKPSCEKRDLTLLISCLQAQFVLEVSSESRSEVQPGRSSAARSVMPPSHLTQLRSAYSSLL